MDAEISDYIAQAAENRGIDPKIALRVARSEGLNEYVGDSGSSFGPFQLHYGNVASGGNRVAGLGDDFTKATGLDARDPRTVKAQVDFALDHAAKHGWGAFHGAAKVGLSDRAGIGGKVAQAAPTMNFLRDFQIEGAPAPAATAQPATAPEAAPTMGFLKDFPIEGEPSAPIAASPAKIAAPSVPASDIGVNAAVRAAATGVPVIGGLLNKADAATNALLAPALNRFFAPQDQLQGNTFAERYKNALAVQEGMDTRFAQEHPIANTGLNIAGAVGGTIPAMMAAPAAFGLNMGVAPGALISGATGAGLNAADTAIRTGDLSLEPGSPIAKSALIGGAFGAAGPIAGAAIGRGIEGAANMLARTSPAARNVADILAEIGLSPTEARNALNRMGPNATLADIDPALTAEAGGLAAQGGAPTSILKTAMAQRASQADNRVASAIEQTLGPRPDMTMAKDAVYQNAQQAAAPYYAGIKAAGGAADITPILNDINAQLKNAVGGEAALLSKAKAYLTDQKVGIPGPDGKPTMMIVPKDDPEALLKVRQALDGDIESLKRNGTIDGTSAGKNAYRAANDIRNQIDAVLKQNPAIAEGDRVFAQGMRVKDALDEGSELFSKGVRVEDFKRSLAGKSPDEVAAMRQGALSAIWEALDNARQGNLSAARSMFGKASANRAKLDALFPNSGKAFDAIATEQAMRSTEQRVAQNSATAERQAVQRKYGQQSAAPLDAAAALAGEAVAGGPGAVAGIGLRSAYGALRNAMAENAMRRLTTGTARGLVATGPEQAAFLAQLGRAYGTNALARGIADNAAFGANLFTRSAPQFGNALAAGTAP